jgi:hypothetical protein
MRETCSRKRQGVGVAYRICPTSCGITDLLNEDLISVSFCNPGTKVGPDARSGFLSGEGFDYQNERRLIATYLSLIPAHS